MKAPCEACPSARRCRDLRLACEAFEVWTNTDTSRWWQTRSRRPGRHIYLRLFGAESLTHRSLTT